MKFNETNNLINERGSELHLGHTWVPSGPVIDLSEVRCAEIGVLVPKTSIEASTSRVAVEEAIINEMGAVKLTGFGAVMGSAQISGVITVEADIATLTALEERLSRNETALARARWSFHWIKKGSYRVTRSIDIGRNSA